MKAVLHESSSTHHYKSKGLSEARMCKLIKKKLEKKAKKLKNAQIHLPEKTGKTDGNKPETE